MDACLMCGGRGTRLDAPVEKPLFEVGGRPMVDRVCDALVASDVDSVVAAVSPHTPETRAHLRERADCTVVETPGEGYVSDLDAVLSDTLTTPVLTCVADLPLLAPELIAETLTTTQNREGASLTVAVPATLKDALGVSADTTMPHEGRPVAPVGLNLVDGEADTLTCSYDARLAVNVDRVADASVAEQLLG